MAINVSDAIDFLLSHSVLKTWTRNEIALAIYSAISQNTFSYDLDNLGKLSAVVVASCEEENTIHVIAIAGKGSLPRFLNQLKQNFPNCKTLTYMRRGKHKQRSVERFYGRR